MGKQNIKTVNLSGSEVEVSVLGGQNTIIKNLGTATIYASAEPSIEPDADGVISIPSGGGENLYGTNGTVYLLGSGKAQLMGTNLSIVNFKQPSSSESGGGGEYTLPPATNASLGGVIIGDGLTVNGAGKVSVKTATKATSGAVIVGEGLAIDERGVLSATSTGNVTKAYVNAQDNVVKNYAVAQDAAVIEYADKQDEAVKAYADEKDAETLASANKHTDNEIAKLQTEIGDNAQEISELSERVKGAETAIDVINGEGEGSVKQSVSEGIAEVVADAPEGFQTLKEIAAWITDHPSDASAMNAQIQQNTQDIATINNADTGIRAQAAKYTDDKIEETKATAEKYADEAAAKALSNAQKYADGKEHKYKEFIVPAGAWHSSGEAAFPWAADIADDTVTANDAARVDFDEASVKAAVAQSTQETVAISGKTAGGKIVLLAINAPKTEMSGVYTITRGSGNIGVVSTNLVIGNCSNSGGGGTPPGDVSDLSILVGNGKATVFWNDPPDAAWKGTKLVYRAGSYAETPSEGTIAVDNQVAGAYVENGFEINSLNNGETYYISLFPYSDTGAVNTNEANRISGTPKAYKIMTAIIDLTNSNPETCITYSDDAVDMTPASDEWDEFFGHYPCLLKNGVEVGKLQRDNFDKFENGDTADISSGNAGDAMIAFPRRGLSIKTVNNKIYISMTDDPDNPDFEYNAHTRGSTAKDVFYLGIYKGFTSGSQLRSLKGKTITANQAIGTFRTQAQANGSGYEQSGFYQLTFRQCMFILKYKTLDSQTAVGQGYVKSGHTAAIATGGTEAWGMDCELIKKSNPTYMTNGNHHVKCFGMEDFWGNIYEWIDGLVSDSSRNVLTANSNFNDTGSGYTNNGNGGLTANVSGWLSVPFGSTKTGFVIKESKGSQTTYFCDYAYLNASCVAYFGGDWYDGAIAGAFDLLVSIAASYSSADLAARLMYL